MKKTRLLHAELSGLIAAFGHGDALVIGDAGLPVPPGVRCIDLAVTRGVPSFAQVLDAVLSELQVERACHAREAAGAGGSFADLLRQRLAGATVEVVDHAELKQRCATARAVVRTGEFTPYANVVLYAGVVF